MAFLGIVMMLFDHGSTVRSVPEFLRLRFNCPTHLLKRDQASPSPRCSSPGSTCTRLSVGARRVAGLAAVGVHRGRGAIVLVYIGIGGLSSAIYNEVLQFFVILAGLYPHHGDRPDQGRRCERARRRGAQQPAWARPACTPGGHRPPRTTRSARTGSAWCSAWVSCCRSATGRPNFAEVQRALWAKNMSAARRTPIIAAFPKLFIPV